MKFKIEVLEKTFTLKIDSVNKVLKALKKQDPRVNYTYMELTGSLCVNIEIDFGLTHTYTLHYPVKWRSNGRPYINTTTPDTKVIIDSILHS